MARGWIHTVFKYGEWLNLVEGGEVISVHRTKDEAVTAGRDRAMRDRTEHLVHNMDGELAYRNSYGNDPFPPRG